MESINRPMAAEAGPNKQFSWHAVKKSPLFHRHSLGHPQSLKISTPVLPSKMEIAEPTKQGSETAVKSHARIQKSSSVHHSLSNRFMKHVKSPESLIPNFQSLKIRPRSTDDRVYLTRGHEVGTFEVPDQPDHTTASNMHEVQDPETPNRRSLSSPLTKEVISEGTGECQQQSPESCQSPSDAVTIRHPPSDLVPERPKHCHQEDDLKAEATDEIRPLSFARRASWRYSGLRNLVLETKRNRIEKQDNVSRGGTSPNPEDEKRSGQPLSPTMAQSIAEMARKRLEWGKKDTKDKTLTKIRNFEGETKPGETDDILPNSVLQRKVKYIRQITGTRVILRSEKDIRPTRGSHDSRKWHARNLRCIFCRFECAICHKPCCVYQKALRAYNIIPRGTKKAEILKLLVLIERLGPLVKDVSTFSKCSAPGGCGRFVCPKCCGACPVTGCSDIQCKECKPDPWAPCDWHE